jgi:3-oxo-5-alpha-steroid 4-dehydrogenase 1
MHPAGLVYYFLCSLTPVLDSPLLGSTGGGYMHSASSALYPWAPLVGSAIFAFGFVMQHIQHRILADLRAPKPAKAGERDDDQQQAQQAAPRRYSIPYGSLFRFVSMPHYLCEMIEYTGLWVLSGFKFSQL